MGYDPFAVKARVQTEENILADLAAIEAGLCQRFHMSAVEQLRRELPGMLRKDEVDEDDLVTRWIERMTAMMEWAEEKADHAKPPPEIADEDDRSYGPQDAALFLSALTQRAG